MVLNNDQSYYGYCVSRCHLWLQSQINMQSCKVWSCTTLNPQSGLYGLQFTPSLCLHLITDSSHIVPIIYRLTTCLFTMSNSTCHRHNDQLNSCMWAAHTHTVDTHTHHSWHLKSSGIHWCFSKLWNSAELSSGLFKYSSNVYFDDWREWQDEALCHPNVDTHTQADAMWKCTFNDIYRLPALPPPPPCASAGNTAEWQQQDFGDCQVESAARSDMRYMCVCETISMEHRHTMHLWGNYGRCWLLKSKELLH